MKITSKEFWNTPIAEMIGPKGHITVIVVSIIVVLSCIFVAGMAAAKLLGT